MGYKVGDKVRIKPKFHFCSVDDFNNINMKDEFFNEYSRLPYCETVMTIGIVNKDFYILKEDKWAYKWTDEMIEGLAEEETKPKMVNLDKACEWLKENIWVYINYEGCSGEELENDVIEDFCKAMGE
jgi:hypothetical protein